MCSLADGTAIVRNTQYGSGQEGGKELSVLFEGGNHYNAVAWDTSTTRSQAAEGCPRATKEQGKSDRSKPAGESSRLEEGRLGTEARTIAASRSGNVRRRSVEGRNRSEVEEGAGAVSQTVGGGGDVAGKKRIHRRRGTMASKWRAAKSKTAAAAGASRSSHSMRKTRWSSADEPPRKWVRASREVRRAAASHSEGDVRRSADVVVREPHEMVRRRIRGKQPVAAFSERG